MTSNTNKLMKLHVYFAVRANLDGLDSIITKLKERMFGMMATLCLVVHLFGIEASSLFITFLVINNYSHDYN